MGQTHLEPATSAITVNTVSPGATDTDLLRGANSDEDLASMPGMSPRGRLGTPADVVASRQAGLNVDVRVKHG